MTNEKGRNVKKEAKDEEENRVEKQVQKIVKFVLRRYKADRISLSQTDRDYIINLIVDAQNFSTANQ